MNFDRFFKTISYIVIFSGFLTLWVSGSIGAFLSIGFILSLIAAWFLEDTRWQISEKIGTFLIFILVPLFYIIWKYQIFTFTSNETVVAGMLARLILGLSVIKLFQKKADRDWWFLYLMSFFEVLLGAALSISPFYLGALILYLFVIVLSIITFEMRKSSRIISIPQDRRFSSGLNNLNKTPFRKLPATSIILLFLIIGFAAPMFFMLPRVGGAGFGSNQGGITSLTGFSDRVRLGEIGKVQQSNEVVMRVRIEDEDKISLNSIKWRGVALDTFDNKSWSKSKPLPQPNFFVRNENNFFQVDYLTGKKSLTVQTFYLEPMDTNVLFALSRPIVVQGNFTDIRRDSYGSILSIRNNFERTSYTVHSEIWTPNIENLRKDNSAYLAENANYLQIPQKFDERIGKLASDVTKDKTNRYDKAKAIEQYLQTQFGYTLDLKAGGEEPLADFLFNVREGHCEYFATAMTMMLRTQGIAARVVNGFQRGEYNETADMFVVKQRDAHSWVEVYFPKEKVWITFDPTPAVGQNISENADFGMMGVARKYLDALEALWIQYFVSYDNQEQRSLLRSMKNGFVEYQEKMTDWLNEYQNKIQVWWTEARGDKGFQASALAIAYGAGYLIAFVSGFLLLQWIFKRLKSLEFWRNLIKWLKNKRQKSIVEFYERMEKVLAKHGFVRQTHQTPLEFAFAINMPEAVSITEKYNRVRFGEKNLTSDEAREIENWLEGLEKKGG